MAPPISALEGLEGECSNAGSCSDCVANSILYCEDENADAQQACIDAECGTMQGGAGDKACENCSYGFTNVLLNYYREVTHKKVTWGRLLCSF